MNGAAVTFTHKYPFFIPYPSFYFSQHVFIFFFIITTTTIFIIIISHSALREQKFILSDLFAF